MNLKDIKKKIKLKKSDEDEHRLSQKVFNKSECSNCNINISNKSQICVES